MAFYMAKYYGVMPHVIWRYPFRYFKELRDHFVDAMKQERGEDRDDKSFDWEDESLTGPPV